MPTPGRNAPCPCGSGLKYKKCCLPKDEGSRADVAPPPQDRVIKHRGRELLTSGSRDLPPGALDVAADFFDAKDRGEGPAARLMQFAAPLVEGAGDDPVRMEKAMGLAMLCWNLALLDPQDREELLAEAASTVFKSAEAEAEFRAMAEAMLERHRQMFPAMHRKHEGDHGGRARAGKRDSRKT